MHRRPRVTIVDLARRAGVSPATVSNVLGGRKRVRPDYARRVREAVAELGYVTDRAGSFLRSGRSRIVGTIIPSLENPFFTSIVAAIERACQADDHELIVASANGDDAIEKARLSALLSWRPAGFILIPNSLAFPARELIEQSGIPYIVADRAIGGITADIIESDNVAAGRLAAEHLVGLGHRDIAVCASSLSIQNIRERAEGVRRVLKEAGLPEARLFEMGLEGNLAERMPAWVAERVRASAFIALTNFATLGMLGALTRQGLAVPDDVSLVGFDDYAWMQVASPSITAVRQPVERIGRMAWDRLKARIDGEAGEPRHFRLPVDLILRDSTSERSTTSGIGLPRAQGA